MKLKTERGYVITIRPLRMLYMFLLVGLIFYLYGWGAGLLAALIPFDVEFRE